MFTKEEEFEFVEYLRDLAYKVAAKYGDDKKLKEASLRGLIEALTKYRGENVDKYKFSTYATWFMKEAVEAELKKGKS